MGKPGTSCLLLLLPMLVPHCLACDNVTFEDKKVVALRYAKPGEFPWAASLQWKYGVIRHFCGASMARPNVALTACHCMMVRSSFDSSVFLADPKVRVLVAGSVNINRAEGNFSTRVVANIERFQAHPKCRAFQSNATDVIHGGWDYDLGLVHLAEDLPFDGTNIGAFRLPSYNPDELRKDMMEKMIKNVKCVVVGWGKRRLRLTKREDPRQYWPELTVITVSLKDFAACYNILCGYHKLYCDIDHWARRQVCATTVGDLEVCQGDSGGPLLCGEGSYLYGVVGWGPNCGEDKGVPSMYATVYDGWDFIIASLAKEQTAAMNSQPQNSPLRFLSMTALTMHCSMRIQHCLQF